MGDVMLDTYIDVVNDHRDDPSSQMGVFHEVRRTNALGGAANVAANLKAMGAEVCLVGLVGNDPASEIITTLMAERGIRNSVISATGRLGRATIQKTRIEGDETFGAVRIDSPPRGITTRREGEVMAEELKDAARNWADGILLSDYGDDVLCAEVMQQLVTLKIVRPDLPIHLDPHVKTKPGITSGPIDCITPNTEEAEELELYQPSRLECVVTTRGPLGADFGDLNVPTDAVPEPKVCGAGDVFAAALLLGRLVSSDWSDVIQIANAAGRAAVLHERTSVVSANGIHDQLPIVVDAEACDVY